MNEKKIDLLEKKIAKALDGARIFDGDIEPETVFSALLSVGFRKVLVAGGSPHALAAAFYDRLVAVLEEPGRPRPLLPRLPKGAW